MTHERVEDEPVDDPADEPATLTNGDLARIFHEIGDMLEVKGELGFKVVAYHRAADAIGRSPVDLVAAYRSGTPPRIPGVGAAISDKLAELARTGHLAFYDRLRAEIPPGLVALLQIPGLGPKTVRQLHLELKIESIDDLRAAAEAGRLRGLRGMSEKTEALVLEGIARLDSTPKRLLLDRAEKLIDGIVELLADTPGLGGLEPAGSFRRKRETIGDLDLLAETSDAGSLIGRFTSLGIVDHVVNQGGYKAAVRLMRGPQVDLMIMPPGEAGTYRIHFTGSKEHNVRLRAMARDQGWSLSEKGFLRIGEDGEPLTGADAELRTFPDETSAYAFLGLPFIEPELREDTGEIEAALAGRLPALIGVDDLAGDLHTHSDWTDGVHSIEVMAEAARRRGYAYQVLTDHTQSLAIARGLRPGPGRRAARDHRGAQPPVRGGGSRRYGAARDATRWVPAPARLRARDPGRRQPRFRGRPAGLVRPRRRLAPRLAPAATGRADPPDPERHPQPARRCHRASGRPDAGHAGRPRSRVGPGLRGSRPNRHGPGDQRVAPPPGPRGRARPPRGCRRVPAERRFRRAQDRRARLRPLGHQPGAARLGRARQRAQHAEPRRAARLGGREAGSDVRSGS